VGLVSAHTAPSRSGSNVEGIVASLASYLLQNRHKTRATAWLLLLPAYACVSNIGASENWRSIESA